MQFFLQAQKLGNFIASSALLPVVFALLAVFPSAPGFTGLAMPPVHVVGSVTRKPEILLVLPKDRLNWECSDRSFL